MTLTADQQSVANDILKKLFEGKEQEIILSGPAGTGKSFLVNYILDDILPKYEKTLQLCNLPRKFLHETPYVTATTNKAVGVLRKNINHYVSTIESALGLVVEGDYTKGEYKLVPCKSGAHQITDCFIIIDEASMIDWTLYKYIRQLCLNCFIIYVGDDCQLPAVKAGNKPIIWQMGLPEYKLTTLVRQAENQELAKLCNYMRDTVYTGQFKPVYCTVTIQHILDQNEQQKILLNEDYQKILTYTNAKAIQYNEWIMEQKYGYSATVYVGEDYVMNDYYQSSDRRVRIPAESVIRVIEVFDKQKVEYNGADCYFYPITALYHDGSTRLLVPEDKIYFRKWLKFVASYKDWRTYFGYKERVVDIRGNYASTIHKAQGSTFEKIIIDANDFKSCTNPAIAARLLYVAVSRARKEIIWFGNLPKKYGGIICQKSKKTPNTRTLLQL